jgi:hypothetical protein
VNIFVTDADPVISAKILDDRRLCKMQLETMQLFTYASGNLGISETLWPKKQGTTEPYKYSKSHGQHPCTLWLAKSRGNAEWLFNHLIALMDEYEHRYGRPCNNRFNLANIQECMKHWPSGEQTPFVNCTFYKNQNIDTITAYQIQMSEKWFLSYQQNKKITLPKWTKSSIPTWYSPIADKMSPEWLSNIEEVRTRNYRNWWI